MSTPAQLDPRVDQAAISDESLLAAHEKVLGKQPDEKAHYRLLPLALLFTFSGLIFFGGTYLGRYAGDFDPRIYNENAKPPRAGEKTAVAPVDPLIMGKAVYGAVCIACHQPTGLGQPPIFPPLVGSEWVTGSEERLIRIVLHGLQGPIKVKGTEYNGAPMPATGPGSAFNLSPEKVAAVLTYVRKEFGEGASPISTEKVAEVRAKEGGNHAPWTAAELEKLP
jgi:mono/diheme cytochrome c family protein